MTAHALIVSPFYVGLCALMFFALSALVIQRRAIHKTWFGDASFGRFVGTNLTFLVLLLGGALLIVKFAGAAIGAG